ncbi:MAG: hypothetical protein ACUVTX_05055 [Bacteroidales bacterium]
MKHFLLIGLILLMRQTIAQDTLSLSVEIDNKPLYLNLDISTGQTYISSKNNTKWIIDKFDDYVEIKSINNQYLHFDKKEKAIIASDNQKARWKLTDLGGLQYFIQPYDDKELYLSLYGSEIRLLPYNLDLMLS